MEGRFLLDTLEIPKGQDFTFELRVFAGNGEGDKPERVQLNASAAAGATSLVIKPLEYALSSGDKLLFGKTTIITLTAGAAAGVEALAVSAIPGTLHSGEFGHKVQDLTGYTIEMEVLNERGEATPVISLTGADITIPSQAGDSRGIVNVSFAAVDTSPAAVLAKHYYGVVWRRNAGAQRRLKELDISIVEAGFL